jgi:hypothetical protein
MYRAHLPPFQGVDAVQAVAGGRALHLRLRVRDQGAEGTTPGEPKGRLCGNRTLCGLLLLRGVACMYQSGLPAEQIT